MDIIVTAHAIQRLKERFGNKFWRYVSHREMIRNLIIGQVSTAHHLEDWKRCAFYKNKMDTTYGVGTEIYLKSGVYYVCQMTDDRLVVKTCVPKILYYKAVDKSA
jgi:hypothetical protein